ncbi:TadE/TadG family type IV pilus assembly protein, partial [Bordetella pertussis]|uniref:TadE/TadG family type IV pilus assembly protein n=1 Tax=Bordetella pertussis TaxID=520 RepID=UPI000ADB40E3
MFVVFFVVLYGGLTWAFIFAAQQSLNHAAEEGARAALQWPGSTALEPRAARAGQLAGQYADWVRRMGGAPATVTVCGSGGPIGGP